MGMNNMRSNFNKVVFEANSFGIEVKENSFGYIQFWSAEDCEAWMIPNSARKYDVYARGVQCKVGTFMKGNAADICLSIAVDGL
jgi:hypothetical protein